MCEKRVHISFDPIGDLSKVYSPLPQKGGVILRILTIFIHLSGCKKLPGLVVSLI